MRQGPCLASAVQVLGGGVALVVSEAVVGVEGVVHGHDVVAVDFGDDGRGGDGDGEGVAVGDAVVRDVDFRQGEGVDEGVLGDGREGGEGFGHGEAAGRGDAKGVDALRRDDAEADGEGLGAYLLGELFTLGGEQHLAVANVGEPGEARARRQDDGGSDDGAGEGAASDFVDAGDESEALFPEGALVVEGWAEGHRCLRWFKAEHVLETMLAQGMTRRKGGGRRCAADVVGAVTRSVGVSLPTRPPELGLIGSDAHLPSPLDEGEAPLTRPPEMSRQVVPRDAAGWLGRGLAAVRGRGRAKALPHGEVRR